MKKISSLEKSYVDFLKNKIKEFETEKNNGLDEIYSMYKNGEINGDSVDLMYENEYKRFENAIEDILYMAISRDCHYKSLYSIARTAFFDEYAADFLNNIIYDIKEGEQSNLPEI